LNGSEKREGKYDNLLKWDEKEESNETRNEGLEKRGTDVGCGGSGGGESLFLVLVVKVVRGNRILGTLDEETKVNDRSRVNKRHESKGNTSLSTPSSSSSSSSSLLLLSGSLSRLALRCTARGKGHAGELISSSSSPPALSEKETG